MLFHNQYTKSALDLMLGEQKKLLEGGGIYYGWCHSSEAWRCKNQAPVLEGLMKSSKNWAIIKRLLQYADIRPKSDTTSSSNYWYKSNKPSTAVSLTGCLFVLVTIFQMHQVLNVAMLHAGFSICRFLCYIFFLSLCY